MGRGNVQVLEVSAGELGVRNDLNLSIADLRDLDDITEVANTAVDLNLVLEELLEGGDVEDLIASGLRSVDDELFDQLAMSKRTISSSCFAEGTMGR